jgi:hypothetical protein
MFMPPISDSPRTPPEGIAMTDPSEIVILASAEVELVVLVVVKSSKSVAIKIMLGTGGMLECARVVGATATRQKVVRGEECMALGLFVMILARWRYVCS